jgi:hypothetical protein
MPVHHNTCECLSCGQFRWGKEWVTYGFQVGDPLTRCVPGLRAQQTFLLEDEAGSDEDTTKYCEDDANDLGSVTWCHSRWKEADARRRMVTLRLPEICKFDVEVEEAEGVVDGDMMVEIKPANFGMKLY